jgi:protein required for attachment to host cells
MEQAMLKKWIIVAEASRARIFEYAGRNAPLRELTDLVHPLSRRPRRELYSDRPARIFRSRGSAGHQVVPCLDAHEQEVDAFAREIAKRLEASRTEHLFDELVLVAAPDFLGSLRAHINTAVAKLITRTVNKDIVRLSEPEIRQRLGLC